MLSYSPQQRRPRLQYSKRIVQRTGYKRFSGFWLNYFKQSIIKLNLKWSDFEMNDEEDETVDQLMVYVEFMRLYKRFFEFSLKNNISLYMVLKLKQQLGSFEKGYGLTKLYNYKRRHQLMLTRQRFDWQFKTFIMQHNKDASLKNLFWLRDVNRRQELFLIWKKYRCLLSWRPFINMHKKYKIFFNWGDKYIYKRFPLYRRKYNISFYYPQFSDFRKLFKNQLKEQHLFRWIFRLKYKQLVNQFKKSALKTKRVFELMFLNFYEMRMDTIIYRLNFAFSIKQAKQWANRSFFKVNSKTINWYSYHVQVGDVITPTLLLRACILKKNPQTTNNKWEFDMGTNFVRLRLFFRYIQSDQYPSHLTVNERIPAGLVISLPDPQQIRHHRPFSIQYLTLSMNKYS